MTDIPPSWLIAGLGNPGSRYAGTRHGLGFMLVDRLAREAGVSWRPERGADVAGPVRWGSGEPALLVKPMQYMNVSGPPLLGLMARQGVPPPRLLVACDDINLPLGKLRLRPAGSAGGHNGLASIIECIGQDFPRLRMGVSREPEGVDRKEWVLSRFGPDEAPLAELMLDQAAMLVRAVLERGIEAVARGVSG